MRLLCVLAVTILAATASADTRRVAFEVVHVLPDTQQVLVFDKANNTHVLLGVGSTLDNYEVVEINGIGMTMENPQHERFMVYPRAAQGLALNLDKGSKTDLPAVYSTVEPTLAPVADNVPALEEVASTIAAMDSTKHIAVELASLFFLAPEVEPTDVAFDQSTSSLISSLR